MKRKLVILAAQIKCTAYTLSLCLSLSLPLPLSLSLSVPTDMEDDIHLLLDCLHFQRDCPSSQRQALTTMATMCAHSSKNKKFNVENIYMVKGGVLISGVVLYTSLCG